MSNAKVCVDHQLEEKELRSIYLTGKHWNDLYRIGNGSPTKAIRKMIEERREREEKSIES